ncbi:DUF4007 family protein [Pseudoalteromonas ruthenica]|uniref:DUF4007 family protein n=1 Tax=Pseudoalteromonas ruthenica TaxID=151081 RepID=UPI00110BD6AA|nr:DUF4007 family protein [Pseudoalteromonas ruthenica]TMO90390.1 DUF4007 domain-containing protein [Pseudoalteromonas ruthenica]TMP23539.1 DUF4007 domain-containing protein [Pseudoalteromonas ruthenica]
MKAKFTGHDTFPLRYGWLFKAINHLNSNGNFSSSDEDSIRHSIVELGVGKNMVKAIQYWAESSSVIKSERKNTSYQHLITKKGQLLFGDGSGESGFDPYLELSGSIWLLHFWLNFNSEHLSAYRYFFNYANVQHFEKSKLIDDCYDDAKRLVDSELGNISTIKKDIDCFLNTYSKKIKALSSKKNNRIDEDHFTSPLAELNLIQDNGGGFYVSNLAERAELPIEIFAYALVEFYKLETIDSKVSTVDFDSLLTKPYSPGRIFRLSESGLGQKLDEIQKLTNSKISWVDSLGLRQVNISPEAKEYSTQFLSDYYGQYNV